MPALSKPFSAADFSPVEEVQRLGAFALLPWPGDDLLVEAGDVAGDRCPAVAAASVGGCLVAAPLPLVWVGGGRTERGRQCRFVVGWYEPAALPVADDFSWPVRGAGDHG